MGGRTKPDGTIAVSDWDHNEANNLGNAVLTKPNALAGYASLAREVKAAGITRIAGNVIIDDRLFEPFLARLLIEALRKPHSANGLCTGRGA